MRNKLQKHVKKLCKKSIHTSTGKDLYDELLQNTLERYDEEVARGRSECDAYDIAIASIGDMDTIIRKNSKRSVPKLLLCAALVVCLTAFVITGCAFMSVEYYDDASRYSVGDATIAEEIRSIDISWAGGAVKISAYDGEKVALSESGAKNEEQKMRYLVENGVLHIRYQASGINFSLPFSKTLELKIPHDMAQNMKDGELDLASADAVLSGLGFERFEIELASGNMTASDCTFESVDADSASGDYRLTNCVIGSVDMSAASGDVKIEGSVSTGEFDCASGNVTIQSDVSPRKLEIDTASGDIKLNIPQDTQFTCEYETASGDIEINGFVGNYRNEKFVCGNGENKYEFDTASGDVTINAE